MLEACQRWLLGNTSRTGSSNYLISVTEATHNPVPRIPLFIYANENRCRHRPGLRYLIYIFTSPDHVNQRAIIRHNWANPDLFSDGRTQLVFMLGVSKDDAVNAIIDDEIRHHNDIVLADYVESYHNLTYKSVIICFDGVQRLCTV